MNHFSVCAGLGRCGFLRRRCGRLGRCGFLRRRRRARAARSVWLPPADSGAAGSGGAASADAGRCGRIGRCGSRRRRCARLGRWHRCGRKFVFRRSNRSQVSGIYVASVLRLCCVCVASVLMVVLVTFSTQYQTDLDHFAARSNTRMFCVFLFYV